MGTFSLDDDADGTQLSSKTFALVAADAPGGTAYTVTETPIPAGWSLTGLSCDDTGDASTTTNLGTATASVNLDEADILTCTFTNTQTIVCGNGVIESGETCDDGNTASSDGCSATCQTEAPPAASCTVLSAPFMCRTERLSADRITASSSWEGSVAQAVMM